VNTSTDVPHVHTFCPHCGHPLWVRTQYLGHRVGCRYCRNAFIAREAGGEESVHPWPPPAGESWKNPCGVGVPGYETLGLVSNGSMGRVYKARQKSVDRVVAVKVLHEDLARRPEYVERFRHEASLASRLAHTHIAHVIDAGTSGDCPFLVMEFADGDTAQEWLDRGETFEEREALAVVLAVAEALDHVHRHGLIHRDVKPGNVILTHDGGVKLIDFGLARPTDDPDWAASEAGQAVGTPYSISPEQTRGETDLDGRTDVYGLGALLYQLATGRPVYVGSSRDMLRQHADPEARPTPAQEVKPGLSDGLAAALDRMLAKDRADRYPTPADVAADLRRLLMETQKSTEPAPPEAPAEQAGTYPDAGPPGEVDPIARASLLARVGDHEGAVAAYDDALAREPGRAVAHRGRADSWWWLSRLDQALSDYTEALRLNPRDPLSLYRRGGLYSRLGRYAEARADLYACVGLDPSSARTWNRLAWLLATCPDSSVRDGPGAVCAATRAYNIASNADANILDTLAASHAEAGDFASAVRRQEEAVAALGDDGPERGAFLERLGIYQAGLAFRSPDAEVSPVAGERPRSPTASP
jgi:serine/threonine-protein kinase